jgi:hypothetical protein
VVKALREWRRNKINRNRFLEMKRSYREKDAERRIDRKGRGKEKNIKEIRTEKEVWKYINLERKERNQ